MSKLFLLALIAITFAENSFAQPSSKGSLDIVDTALNKPTTPRLAVNKRDNLVYYWNLKYWAKVDEGEFSDEVYPVTQAQEYLKTWTAQTTPIDRVWVGLAWSPELRLLVSVSHGATADGVMTSPDGVNWTARTCPAQEWRGVAWSAKLGLFAAVGGTGTGNRVMTSPDGISWTNRASTGDYKWRDIVWSDEKEIFVAVANTTGFTNKVMTSIDGINWVARTTPDRAWSDITYAPELGLFVVSATHGIAGGKIMTSPDGKVWTLRTTPGDLASWEGLGYSEDLRLLVAVSYYNVANTNYPGRRVMTSPDGTNWTLRSTPLDAQWLSVAWSHELGMFAAVCDDNTQGVMVSPDGITWTLRTPDMYRFWRRIIWVKELGSFVSVAYTFALSGVGNLVMLSKPTDPYQQYLALRGRAKQTVTGNVVFKDTITIDRDVTVNGYTLGRGFGNVLGNTVFGYEAGKQQTSTYSAWNTAVGYHALRLNRVKGWNTAMGLFSLANYNDPDSTSLPAGNNTAYGANSLRFTTLGKWNTAVGAAAFLNLTTGINNTGMGLNVGKGITTGSYNTIIGVFETAPFAASTSNLVALGDGLGNIRFYSPASGNVLFGTTTDDGINKVQVNGSISTTKYHVSALNTAPSSASDTGVLGEIRITATYIYVCTATNTWVRTQLVTW